MTRDAAIARAHAAFDGGSFREDLADLVAVRTESQRQEGAAELRRYLVDGVGPRLAAIGCRLSMHDNPVAGRGPFLVAERTEDPGLPTVLTYGHGDVVNGMEGRWAGGRDPWAVTVDGERWYGRGVADNKGQHLVNLTALRAVLETRGRLGFNLKVLVETGEECGSPGLEAFAETHRDALAADVLIGSDGPRLAPGRPLLYLGTRGVMNFELRCDLRPGGHHSGNWGGALANPGTILANAIASMVDGRGRILVDGLRPPAAPESVRRAVEGLLPDGGADGPEIDPDWGEPGLSTSERVYAWNALEVLAFRTGDPDRPANAIPGGAHAHLQLRYVVGTDWRNILEHVRAHLDAHGFPSVQVRPTRETAMAPTRLDPEDRWVRFAAASIERTTGAPPQVLPNLGGSLPNAVFAETIGVPTVWIPHSYAGCSQHAPDEHGLAPILRQGLGIMAGIWWDLGERPPA